jgi:hypothetical protein
LEPKDINQKTELFFHGCGRRRFRIGSVGKSTNGSTPRRPMKRQRSRLAYRRQSSRCCSRLRARRTRLRTVINDRALSIVSAAIVRIRIGTRSNRGQNITVQVPSELYTRDARCTELSISGERRMRLVFHRSTTRIPRYTPFVQYAFEELLLREDPLPPRDGYVAQDAVEAVLHLSVLLGP